jgi:Ca-activated chloride channel family protein
MIPLVVLIYILMLRRRRRFAVRYSSLALVRAALPRQSWWRRYLPLALFLLALTSLVVAVGRPVATVNVPIGQTTIILAMDVSRSMCSTDVPPNRLEAAKDAAINFIEGQKSNTQIGIVAFAGFAALIQPPTEDQDALQEAIENLTTARRTAIGSAILESLDAIAEVNDEVAPSDPAFAEQPPPPQEAQYVPDIIVLLTDGASNTGPFPVDAAQQAADRGVRVYTIGFGTDQGGMMECNDPFGGQEWFGGGGQGFGGGGFRRGIDEETLKQVADLTGGAYYPARSASELEDVFDELPKYLITKKEFTEISVAFTAAGALLAAMAIGLSLLWHPLP